jgi:hypothetical protein
VRSGRFVIMPSLPLFSILLLRPTYLHQRPFLKHRQNICLPDHVSYPSKATGKIIFLYVLIVIFLDPISFSVIQSELKQSC